MINQKILDEYNAVKKDAGLFDFSFEGKIKVTGQGRTDFINGIVSNDVKNLKENYGVYAAFLDKFGRVLSDCHIYKFRDFLLITSPFIQKNKIFEKLKEEAVLAKSEVEDITLKYAMLSLQGPKSILLLKNLFNEKIQLKNSEFTSKKINNETLNKTNAKLPINKENQIKNNNENIDITIIKTKRSNEGCFDLFFEGGNYKKIIELIFNKGKKYNLMKISNETYNILMLEAGIPLFGIDFDEKTILTEIGEKAISYEKGCYVGQEVIARIKNIGKGITAKKLMRFEINSDKEFGKGTEIFKNNKKIGFITSSSYSPGLNKVVALGFLDRNFYDKAKEIEVGKDKAKALVFGL